MTPFPLTERRLPALRNDFSCRLLVQRIRLGAGDHRFGDETGIGADRLLDGVGDFGMVAQIGLGVLAPLADPVAVVGEPRPRLLDHVGLHARSEEPTSELQSLMRISYA